MSNNGCRIVLERHDDGRWWWELTYYGARHVAPRSEQSAELAAQAANTFRNHLHIFKDRPQPEAI